VRSAAARDPLYVRLASEFRRQIDDGVLRAGDKLPSIRALRHGRRVSTATVMDAYLRLERDGYVRARDRSGFYVAQPPARTLPEPLAPSALVPPVPVGISELVAQVIREAADGKCVPLGVSTLGPTLLPIARLNRAFRRAAARWPLHSATYGSIRGQMPLRRQIARRALTSGLTCDPENIIITSGGIDALNLALRAVAAPGDVVAVESPTYFGVLQVLEALGLRAVEVPADSHSGIDLGLLDRAIKRHRVKAVVSMTTCHNPLGSVMSEPPRPILSP
jgi:DNA-binding transcriptional MocR family regulator